MTSVLSEPSLVLTQGQLKLHKIVPDNLVIRTVLTKDGLYATYAGRVIAPGNLVRGNV